MERKKRGRWCAAVNCRNCSTLQRDISFFRFPRDPERCATWIKNCGRLDLLEKSPEYCHNNCHLCAWHFQTEMFLNDMHNRLQPTAIPTLFRWPLNETAGPLNLETAEEKENIEPLTKKQRSIEPTEAELPIQIHRKDEPLPRESARNTLEEPTPSTSRMIDEIEQPANTVNTQTPVSFIMKTKTIAKLQRKLKQQKNKIAQLEVQLQQLNAVDQCEDQQTMLVQLCEKFVGPQMAQFIKMQLELAKVKRHGSRYSQEFKQWCLTIYFLGPAVYRFLMRMFHFPSVRTLRRMSEKWEIVPGLTEFLFQALQLKIETMTATDKDVILCADEISLKSHLFYNIHKDEITGFTQFNSVKRFEQAKYACVLMIRGIHSNWKQPIAYVFVHSPCSGTDLKDVIFGSITKLCSVGITVRALITDMGPNFYQFANALKVTPEKSYFVVDAQKIVYIFDPPHLLKALRNNFFRYSLITNEGTVEKKYLDQFYRKDKTQTFRAAKNLTDAHINPTPFQKMKVKLAAQIFSASVAAGMALHVAVGLLPISANPTITFIDNMDKLFDIMNSSRKESVKMYNKAFVGAEYQLNFLHEMDQLLADIQAVDRDGKNITHTVKCFKCWRTTIHSILDLWNILDVPTLYTRRLNQNCLENFFGTLRQQGGIERNPTPIQFKRAFRKLFCLEYFHCNPNANCAEDLDTVLIKLNRLPSAISTIMGAAVPAHSEVHIADAVSIVDYRTLDLPEENALRYVCGYLLRKCLDKHSCRTCLEYATNPPDLQHTTLLSHFKAYETDDVDIYGKLFVPSDEFVAFISALEEQFQIIFPQVCFKPQVAFNMKRHLEHFCFKHPCSAFPHSFLIALFIRVRIFYCLKFTNRTISKGPKVPLAIAGQL